MGRIDVENHEVEIHDCTSTENQRRNIPLAISIRDMIDKLEPLSHDCCIYRVPERYRKLNEKAYTPQIVSIGPFHHGKGNLEAMEEQKLRYLQAFLDRTGMSLDTCILAMKEWEERARSYYAETIKLDSDKFVKMLLLDSSFIIVVILRYNFYLKEQNDYLNRPHLIVPVRKDMVLLENQLPFFVLNGLFNLAFPSYIDTQLSFLLLSIKYFKKLCLIELTHELNSSSEVKHFLDLLRTCHLPSSIRSLPPDGANFVKKCNATELQKAGLKFKKGSSNHLLDIQYNWGVLEIPQFCIHDGTECVLRNLIALEQCHYMFDSYIMDYIFFMDSLIDTAKDANLLIQNEIVESQLNNSSGVANLFNSLSTEMCYVGENYYYYSISENLNAFRRVRWHKWKATLRREYFSSPWRIISIIAAVMLLLLALVQAICSVLSLLS